MKIIMWNCRKPSPAVSAASPPCSRAGAGFACVVAGILWAGCQGLSGAEPAAKVDNSLAQQMGPYSGPKASVAVAKFEWKVGGGKEGSVRVETPQGVYAYSV